MTSSTPRRHHLVLLDADDDAYKVVNDDGLLERTLVKRSSFEHWLEALRGRGWKVISDAAQLEPAGRILVLERPARAS